MARNYLHFTVIVSISSGCSYMTSYRPQRSWAKVMFLQASVILSGEGWWSGPGGLQFSGGLQFFGGGGLIQIFFKFKFFFNSNFFPPKFLLGCTPPGYGH